jgi:transcription termination factor Rho
MGAGSLDCTPMSILDRSALEQSPLADLHAIASELSIDSYRRLRKEELIDAILARQSGEEGTSEDEDEVIDAEELAEAVEDEILAREGEGAAPRRRRGRRGGRGRSEPRERIVDDEERDEQEPAAGPEGVGEIESRLGDAGGDDVVEGVVELLPGGSAFVRLNPPDPSDDDVYVSAAQVRRCELVSGDRVSGRRRPPRRSERFASLVRVESVNGRSAEELADAVRFDDLPVEFPSRPLRTSFEDPTLSAVVSLAPLGRGSRVTIAGPAHAGKTEALRRLAVELDREEGLDVLVVLVGTRPEEIAEWQSGPVAPATAINFGASLDAQSQALDVVVEQARRKVSRGDHVAVLIDTLDCVHDNVARRALASARSIVGGGSLTVIATTSHPVGGETTVIGLDPQLALTGRFPAIDPRRTWTLRAGRLVGEQGAEEIAAARAQAFVD